MKYLWFLILIPFVIATSDYANNKIRVDSNGTLFVDTIVTEFMYAKTKAHGFYAFEDSSVVIDCVQNVWVNITNATGNLFTEIQTNEGFIISGDTITYNNFGRGGLFPHVKIEYEADGSGGNNKIFSFRIYNIDNDAGVVKKVTTKAGVNDQVAISGLAYDRHASINDRYVFQVMNKTDNTNFTINDGAIYLEVSHY